MVQDRDVQDLLSTGIWTTQRAKSPRSSNPVRANQSHKLAPLNSNDPKIPRTFSYLSHTRFPPSPSVEDEEDSIAKESNGSIVNLDEEEPKCRGEVDQFPIILPVPEHNPERRFVLVAPSETDEGNLSDGSNTPSTTTKYTANARVQPDLKANTSKNEPPSLEKRRSRTDLPRIETASRHHNQHRPTTYVHRSRSATYVDQSHRDTSPRDYFSPHPESARPTGEPFLTPVVKHATKGRDRAYWDFNSGSNGTRPGDPSLNEKPRSAEQQGLDGYSRSPHRRLHSDLEVPKVKRTVERHGSYRDEPHDRTRNDRLSPPSDRKRSPPRPSHRESSEARPREESLRIPRNPSSYHGRSPTHREAALESSSDEGRDHKSKRHHRERRRSTVIHEDRSAFLGAAGPRSSHISKSRSKPPSPLPSPSPSQEKFFEHRTQPGPRSSTTLSATRPSSPTPSGRSSSPLSRSRSGVDDHVPDLCRPSRAPSRTPSIRSNASSSKPVNAPLSLSIPSLPPLAIPSDDRKRQTMPPTPTWSRQGSLDTASGWHPESLQPPPTLAIPLTPRHSETNLEQLGPSILSYRRYAEDVSAGTRPDISDCPRKRPRAGRTDWFTLPKNDTVNICPSCYDQVFYPTAFRDLLVPAPPRPRDRALACDLGASPWHRIAWLMTRKHRRADLRLLQGVADVALKNRVPCCGPARVTRPWHSILDPETRRCISSFKVCTPCAEAVQVLFPSLTGVFVPLDHRAAEPRAGQCSLHFAPHRARFLTYFDVLEDTHDRAMARNTVPDIQRLVERIDSWAGIDECPGDEPLRHASWYTMAHVPEMTVCEDCFLSMVYPELVDDAEAIANGTSGESGQAVNAVARDFNMKPQLIRSATVCQMASPWMKDLFRRACKRPDGVIYLESKIKDRVRSL